MSGDPGKSGGSSIPADAPIPLPVEHARAQGSTRRRRTSVLVAALALALVASGCLPAPPLGPVYIQQAAAPQYPVLSDPAALADGGKFYIYGSNTAQNRMPIHEVPNLTTVYSDPVWHNTRIEGMPTKPAWSRDDGIFWAPTVAKAANGTYVAYFAANRPNPPQPWNSQCIGRATSSSPKGPFVAEPGPFTCGLNGTGGALDPNLFRDKDGKWWLLVAFGDTDAPIRIFSLDANLDATRVYYGLAAPHDWAVYGRIFPWEGGFIENPSMLYDPTDNTYLLAYSGGGDWWGPDYVTGLARCAAPDGFCSGNPYGSWLRKSNGRTGTGGLSFFLKEDGTPMAIYASFAAGTEGVQSRSGTVASVSLGPNGPALGPP